MHFGAHSQRENPLENLYMKGPPIVIQWKVGQEICLGVLNPRNVHCSIVRQILLSLCHDCLYF